MNICVFSIVSYWHGLKGGMDLHGKHLLEGLVRKGHKVTVIATRHPLKGKQAQIVGIRFFFLQDTTFGSSRKKWRRESLKKFLEISRKERIDVVISQSKAGYGVVKTVRQAGIPFVTILHGYETMIWLSVFNQVRNLKRGYASLIKSFLACIYYSLFQEYPLLMHSSSIIAVSEKVAAVFRRRPFVKEDKITVVQNGIDLETFRPSEENRRDTRKALNISGEDRVVLFLSLISKQKGADVAIRAMRNLSGIENLKLIVAGEGEYLAEAKRLAQEYSLEDRVIFPGFIPNEEASRYYNASDIFVFPTLRHESFGIVLAEAMACEKPVIASDIGSIPEVIDDGINGILIPAGDDQALADRILLLLDNGDLAQSLSRNARSKALARFGLDRMVEETSERICLAVDDRLH